MKLSAPVHEGRLRIAVGMSGGVDSTVTAYLLKQQGHDVTGITMQIWDASIPLEDKGISGCFGPGEARDIEEAGRLADLIGIRHEVVPLATEYRRTVLDYFRAEYLAGRTPNPCVRCNHTMKFGFLIERAREIGLNFDFFATGHYARVMRDEESGRHVLMKGVDRSKDQSYFLSLLRQDQLARVLFPLGDLTKAQVKEMACGLGLADVAARQESQDFIESEDYGVLFDKEELRPGPILDTAGRRLGEHRGIVHYTIGQRKGLGIGGAAEPYYVVAIDGCANTVIVGNKEDLSHTGLLATNLNWIAAESFEHALAVFPERVSPGKPSVLRTSTRIRQQHREAPAGMSPANPAGDSVTVTFDEPQTSITPGQIAVFYIDDAVLGSGTIAASAT